MFAPGELIYCGRRGVCRVENIEEIDGRPYLNKAQPQQDGLCWGCVVQWIPCTM